MEQERPLGMWTTNRDVALTFGGNIDKMKSKIRIQSVVHQLGEGFGVWKQ